MTEPTVLKDLGGGLILRRSTRADTEAVAKFQARIHAENEIHFDEGIEWWIRDIMSGRHPTFHEDDFTIVEDTATGKIVSSLCLIDQTWAYEGIPFKVGRPEVVATEPEYRNRGLVREQFDVIHGWSAERGQMAQAITGIPYYYRVFGYEMGALDMETGWKVFEHQIPKAVENEPAPFLFRPAAPADIPLIMQLYAQQTAREAVTCVRGEAEWAYQFQASERNCDRERMAIITQPDGQPVGMVMYSNQLWGPMMPVVMIEILPGHPWMQPCREALRFLWQEGLALREKLGGEFTTLTLWMGREHPAYEALSGRLTRPQRSYAYYIRVPDVAGFIDHIHPALEKRLASSVAAGYSGELKISLYRSLLTLRFDQGKMLPVQVTKEVNATSMAAFPELVFLRLLFGANSLDELQTMFADITFETLSDARPLLNALFPKKQSNVLVLS